MLRKISQLIRIPAITTLVMMGLFAAPLAFSGVSFAATPSPALDSKKLACEGVGLTGTACNTPGAGTKVSDVVVNVIKFITYVVGIVAVIMIMVGGFKFVTSAGDASKTASAKSTLIWALVGLMVVALAQFIINFVMGFAG